ncbi:hypothetical protein [Pseudonocardia alaniniphila]|uniref:Uncharacterized protein n=1 Tax=Pseudonocardia alaniniphila TaxID=75291 RepID=A0ABS9TGJ1_9PSEU|nr:hypothetical protein [Pseudonocardia alaniniphila]MCH6167660.1 hypothetical protein [Pseudonocardia alaniniphila]
MLRRGGAPRREVREPTAGNCFAAAGGTTERAGAIGVAIAAHITTGAAEDLADPGGLVSVGALLDLAGQRLDEVEPR